MLSALLDLVLPVHCAGCERRVGGRSEGIVCGLCWAGLHKLPSPKCERCGHPTQGRKCRWCDLLPPFVRCARSAVWTGNGLGTSQQLLHALKYDGWTAVADGMAERMARLDWPRDVLDERAFVVPVPLAAKKERERGYNQSELLAIPLARRWGIPVRLDLLTRTRATQTQTRLTPGERLRNVSGAFRAPESARKLLRAAHVVLVDDVVTTAATLNACAAALCQGGARIVSFVTFARAPAAGDRR